MAALLQARASTSDHLGPEIESGDEARDEYLGYNRAIEILDHLERFAYASRDHVLVAIVWHTGISLGSLRAFDVGDFHSGCNVS